MTSSSEKPFPFFRLPFELREMTYKELFVSPRADKVVTPDPIRTRRRSWLQTENNCDTDDNADYQELIERTLNLQGLALLRTCSQVQREGTTVMYGENVFNFSDYAHCKEINTSEGPKFLGPGNWKHYPGQPKLPDCDFSFMAYFFGAIGDHSLCRIKHLELDFYTRTFLNYQDKDFDGYYSGGKFLGDALDVLAKAHMLKTLTLTFNACFDDVPTKLSRECLIPPPVPRFLEPRKHKIWKKLTQVEGLKELRILELKILEYEEPNGSFLGTSDLSAENIAYLKSVMQGGYEKRAECEWLKKDFPVAKGIDQATIFT